MTIIIKWLFITLIICIPNGNPPISDNPNKKITGERDPQKETFHPHTSSLSLYPTDHFPRYHYLWFNFGKLTNIS